MNRSVEVGEKQDTQALKLYVVLSRAKEALTQIACEDVKSSQLNLTEFGVLELLYHKGEQPIQLIGKKILLASSSITYVVDKLEEKGLLTRQACPEDRRVTYAVISEKGRLLMAKIFPSHQKVISQALSHLTHKEQKEAIYLLKKIGLGAQESELANRD